jgi:hypothetical protein
MAVHEQAVTGHSSGAVAVSVGVIMGKVLLEQHFSHDHQGADHPVGAVGAVRGTTGG